MILNGTYVIYNPDGDRHPNKFLHIRGDEYVQAYGPIDDEHFNDVNRHWTIEPYKIIKGKQTYLIYNPDGNRNPNSYLHIASDGCVFPHGPMTSEYKEDCNRHFVIEEYDKTW